MVLKNGANQGNGNWTMWYTANVNPMATEAALWMINNDGEYQVITNFIRPETMLQTEGGGATWNYHCTDNGGGNLYWGHTKFAYLPDGYWTIQVQEGGNYVGPWDDNFVDGAEVAGNKNGGSTGNFDIFAITRAQYWTNRANAGFTTYPVNMTGAIVNPEGLFQPSEAGWTESYTDPRSNGYTFQRQTNNGQDGIKHAQFFFESWQGSGNLSDRQMSQTKDYLPNGYYKFSALTGSTVSGAFLFANNNQADFTTKENNIVSLEFKKEASDTSVELGVKLDDYQGNWVTFDQFELTFYGLPINKEAVVLPANGDMAANTWYYLDVTSAGDYSAIATTLGDIVYTTDGDLQIDDTSITDYFDASSNPLTIQRYYIKSTSANNFRIDAPRATAAQMEQLASAITAAEAHTLGFDENDYAPYKNVDAITKLAAAKEVDRNNPTNYTQSFIAGKITDMQNATWTANSSEVNGIAYGNLSTYETRDDHDFPYGWSGYNAEGQTNNLSRIMGGTEGSNNAGLAATSTGKAMLLKGNATYGAILGYTLPLKANTTYMLKFTYCGWGGNTPTTNVVLTGPNGGVTVLPGSFKPATGDGQADASHWYEYVAIFKTGETAGDYTLNLNKVEGGQQQIAWGDMELKRASGYTQLPYTLESRPKNADIATAQASAETTFTNTPSFDNYQALLTAINNAKQSADVYETINTRLTLLKAQLGDIPVPSMEADAVCTNYDNGLYTNLNEVVPLYKTFVQNYWSTNAPEENDNLTAFIVNQGFQFGDHDTTGWNGLNNIEAGRVNHGTIEKWNGNCDFYQTLSGLPNGTYKLQVQGYYRPGNNDTTNSSTQNALIYGGSTTAPVMLIATEGKAAQDNDNGFTTSNNNSSSEVFVPNSQGDAEKAFAYGAYDNNEVTFVVSNGTVNIGFKKTETIGGDWMCFDNFRLYYVSADAEVAPELPTGQMNADVKAAMLLAKGTWEGSMTQENYNNLLTAIDNANASIALYQQINTRLGKLTAESQRGSISENDMKAMSFYTKYSDGALENTGTYTSLDQIVDEYKANVSSYWTTNAPAANADLTAFIFNQGFEYAGNGEARVEATEWRGANWGDNADHGARNYGLSGKEGDYIFNTWNSGGNDYVWFAQDITGLPNGTYEVSALWGAYNDQGINFILDNIREDGTKDGNRITVTGQGDNTGVLATQQVVVTNGKLTISANNNNRFFKADNFRLKFLSSEAPAPTLVDEPMNTGIRTDQQAAFNTWNADKTMANYEALLDAIKAARESADKYVIIDQRIPNLQAQADNIDATILRTKYTNGEYVEADEVFAAYRTVIADYYAANPPADGADMTRFLINPDFEYGNIDGWNADPSTDMGARDANNATYSFTNSHGNWVFNSWNNNDGNGNMIAVWQTTTGLPQGTYEVTTVLAGHKNFTLEFTAEDIQPQGSEQKISFQPVDEDIYADKTKGYEKTITVFVSDGKLRVGAHAWGFFKCDNFRLKFISSDINDPDLTKPMNRYEREYYVNARAAYDANPTQENLNELLECKLVVENSIEAYKAAKNTFDHVLEMMNKTNVYTYDAYFTIDDMYRKYGPAEGYYFYETLEDDEAFDMWRKFFGNQRYRDANDFKIPAVPFIASAWNCGHDGYAYAYTGPGEEGTDHGSDYYANTWSMEGKDDGTFMYLPYLEYWREEDNLLDGKEMIATVEGTPGAEYTVKMLVRVRTYPDYADPYPDSENPDIDPMTIAGYPKGMTIQIGDGTPVTPRWTKVNNWGSPYAGTNGNKLWICDLWDYATNDLPKGHVEQDGKLRIKFILDENVNNGGTSNVAWLSFKNVYVNYDNEDLTGILATLNAQVKTDSLAYYTKLGFDPGEYAPYTNVEQLRAFQRARQVRDASENYFLVKTAYDKLVSFSGHWNQNTKEMNGFYWTNDYTSADVEHVEWYDLEDDCITPTGWNLIGRDDGFNTGIKKLGVNIDAEGMKAIDGETGLYAKYETDYGQEIGYTLPLKAGVKYIMTFTYAYDGTGECPFKTSISMSAPRVTNNEQLPVLREPLTVSEIQPSQDNDANLPNWYMYRATFVPEFDADYVITFDKDNVDPEPIIMGELTLVRYYESDATDPNDADVYVINAQSTTMDDQMAEPKLEGRNVRITRSFNAGAYNTLVLPFKLSGDELKTALGNNFDGNVYYYTGVGTTTGENRDYYQLQFEKRTYGIFANVPVLFYSDANNPVNNWTNKVFNKMVTKRVENDLTVDKDVFDFVGVYKVQKVPEGGWYIKGDNNFYKSTNTNPKGLANIQPTRGYFIPFDSSGNPILHAKIMGFDIDGEPTGIMAIEEDGSMRVTSGNIYSVDGRLIRSNATSLEGLPRGTYIVDGKKYMIK